MPPTTYDIKKSYKLTYMFSAQYHFSSAGMWKSGGDAQYIRGAIFVRISCFSYKLSYMFSVRLHFPLTDRGKSDGDAKYIRGHILNI